MKINRFTIAFSALGVALIAAATAEALHSELRLDAPTEEGKVTQLTVQVLEQAQLSHHRLDDATAAKFFDRYLDSFDGTHELFLQSDVAELRRSVPKLAEAIRAKGDTTLAHAVFARYLQRLDERAAFVAETLKDEKFDFTGHDRFSTDREHAPRPQDLAEAHELWRQRLRAELLQEKLGAKKPEDLAQTLTRRYARQAQTMKKLSADSVLEIYLNALAHVYDPHSDYMGPEELQSFTIAMNLSLAGIGATLEADDGYCKIRELVPGGPAARSGKLKVGDRIVAVSQGPGKEPTDIVDVPLPQAVELIRGAKGTEVTLTILPAGVGDDARETVTIQRDIVHLDEQEAKARVVDLPVNGGKSVRLGVIDLPAFYTHEHGRGDSATADVAKLIRKLQREQVRGLVLDLRHNGGGSLDEAVNLTGLFIPSGPVVQTRDLAGRVKVESDHEGKPLYDGPLVVLTSRFSASASEIVAGALQDYGRALLVGDSSTFGKGTVQTILSLDAIMRHESIKPESDPGALKVTISKFYRPSGNSTQLRGVHPEIVLPSFTDSAEISESGMKNPLEWDSVPPAHYTHFDLVAPWVAKLREESTARMAADRDFKWWNQDLALVVKNRATKSVSLNEAEREKEKADAEARTKAREAERLAHKDVEPPVYEITVKNAAAPGLPPPSDPAKLKAAAGEAKNDDTADSGDPAVPAPDLLLRETEHILADYIDLLAPAGAPRLTRR